MEKQIEVKKDKFECCGCGGKTIYISKWAYDHRGTLTCFTCGETEDSRSGLKKNGKKIETFKNYLTGPFSDDEVKPSRKKSGVLRDRT